MIENFIKEHPEDESVRSVEDPSMKLHGDLTPNNVRLPASLGGTAHAVASTMKGGCVCGLAHEAVTHELEGTDVRVTECVYQGFLWWTPRPVEGLDTAGMSPSMCEVLLQILDGEYQGIPIRTGRALKNRGLVYTDRYSVWRLTTKGRLLAEKMRTQAI